MATNLDNLKDIAEFSVNTTRIGTGTDVPLKLITYTKDTLGNLWLDGTILILFITGLWYYSKKTDPDAYDFFRAMTISSIFAFVVSAGLLLSNFSRNISPLLLYGSLSILGFIFTYLNKKKGF